MPDGVDYWMSVLRNDIKKADIVMVQLLRGKVDSCFGNCTANLVMNAQAEQAVQRAVSAVNDYCEQIETRGLFPSAKVELEKIKAETLELVQEAHDALSKLQPNQRARNLGLD